MTPRIRVWSGRRWRRKCPDKDFEFVALDSELELDDSEKDFYADGWLSSWAEIKGDEDYVFVCRRVQDFCWYLRSCQHFRNFWWYRLIGWQNVFKELEGRKVIGESWVTRKF